MGKDALGRALIDPTTTTPHQQLTTTIDTILHIAPPDDSDVRKGKKKHSNTSKLTIDPHARI